MKPLGGIGIGVDAGVIGGELLHLVEAVIRWIGYWLVAEVPLAGEVRRVAVLLKEFGNRWRLRTEVVLVARGNHDRKRRADGNASGHKRGAACRTACLAVPTGEDRAFLGHLVDVGRRVTQGHTTSRIRPKIVPSR